MFIGGLRAILLQSLHPLAMAGVAGHSDFRRDPWGRLQRTAAFLTATTYGTADDADAAVARVRCIHGHVHGTAPDGRPYSADDSHLLRWVHVAEVDSFLAAHRRYAPDPLDADEHDGYVADMAVHRPGPRRPRAAPRRCAPRRPAARLPSANCGARPEARDVARYLVFDPPLDVTRCARRTR